MPYSSGDPRELGCTLEMTGLQYFVKIISPKCLFKCLFIAEPKILVRAWAGPHRFRVHVTPPPTLSPVLMLRYGGRWEVGQRAQPLLPPESIFRTLGAEHIHPVFLWKTRLITSLLLSTKEGEGLPRQGPDWARHSPEVMQQNLWQIQRLRGRTPGPVPSASI